MLEIIKNFSRFLLDAAGLEIVHSSNKAEFNRFLAMLRPKRSQFPLIRIGGSNDGGYLVPLDLDAIDAVFSPGVAECSRFELFFLERNIKCYLADNSVSVAPVVHVDIVFEKKHLGTFQSHNLMTLQNWVSRNAPESKHLLLQMDIEGAEWDVLLNSPIEILEQFRIIVVEFHDLHRIINSRGLASAFSVFEHLLSVFEIVHLHPNNGGGFIRFRGKALPRVVEISFLRRDRSSFFDDLTIFEHPLDEPNIPTIPNFKISSKLFR